MFNYTVHLMGKNSAGEDCILSAHDIRSEVLELMLKNKKIHVDGKHYEIVDSYIATSIQYPTKLFVMEVH